MIFLLVSGLAVLLAVLRVQTMRVGEPAVIRSALVRGGLAYLAFWIVGTGILGPAGPLAIPGVASRILLDLGWILSALLAVILWVALVDLAFYRFQKRDLVWIVPFGAAVASSSPATRLFCCGRNSIAKWMPARSRPGIGRSRGFSEPPESSTAS